ncbi:FimV/HubP family polar landmark protein [Vibrio anguillarum]|uniref:FimV/HubP family polar landmark protein n=4 Tax=Vibrio anguillarum TaxID=55601 RepID=UPI003BF5C46E
MRQIFQRLLLPIAMVAVTQTSIVSAESIRLVGPNGEIQSSPQFSENLTQTRNLQQANSQPSTFFGPTLDSDTLWSIATRLRPSNNVTVQQTLLAIYRLNPQAFENQNIHSLIPGSNLRVPSLAQVNSAPTQEAVNIMAAHQAKLNANTAQPTAPVTAASTALPEKTIASTVAQPVVEKTKSEPVLKDIGTQVAKSDTELLALEEKNHKLRLMLADVQSEVDALKGELGDENRIRSEVEKLLDEERRKALEAQKLAPSALDQLLSNSWLVAALALIPGLLIGLLVVMLLGRRSKPTEQPVVTQGNQEPITPMAVGSLEDIDDDLMLDDDLFGESDDSEKLFGDDITLDDEIDDNAEQESDIFADLDDTDLDFNLEGEDGEDPFASIGDDGDLAADLEDLTASSNGISVGADEKAVGLDEMARALDEALLDEDDSETEFDLSDDDDSISEDDIDALLAGDDKAEDLGSDTLDQSLLDDLFAANSDDDHHDSFDFDSLLDESEDDFNLDSEEPELAKTGGNFDLKEAELASDSELDDLFATIEAQSDLTSIETDSSTETALLDELLEEQDEDVLAIDSDSVELLDELLGDDEESETDLSESTDLLEELVQPDKDIASSEEDIDDVDFTGDQTLYELLGEETTESDIETELDENSTELLDELFTDNGSESLEFEKADQEQEGAEDKDSLAEEDGTALFEELLEIEQHAQNIEETEQQYSEFLDNENDSVEDSEFNSDIFIDDLLSAAPEKDPLLDDEQMGVVDGDIDEEFIDDSFDFNPEIEGASYPDLKPNEEQPLSSSTSPEKIEPAQVSKPEVSPNEFGVPQDEDWDIGELEEEEPSQADVEPLQTNSAESSAKDHVEELHDDKLVELEEEDLLASFNEPSLEEQSQSELSEVQLPEPSEEDALADAIAEPQEAESEPVAQESFEAIDEEALPEFSEEDALASINEPPLEEEKEDERDLTDLELPEYTEEDALADAIAEPQEAASEPVVQESFEAIDEQALPEFSEEDALASINEPPLEEEKEDERDLTDLELPEYTEEDALADAIAEPQEAASEPVAQERFEPIDEQALPEFSEEDALASINEPPLEAKEDESDLTDLELPEYTEEDALADEIAEPQEAASEPVAQESFEAIDEQALPEFSEEDALASINEPPLEEKEDESDLTDLELPEYTEEDALVDAIAEPQEAASEPVAQENFEAIDEQSLPEFGEEDALASINEPPLEEKEDESDLTDLELPEYTEEDALVDAIAEPQEAASEPVAQENFEAIDEQSLPEFGEEDALASINEPALETDQQPLLEDDDADQLQSVSKQEFDEKALKDWLDEESVSSAPFSFDRPLDARTIDSAGMNIDAMLEVGGEDWNGFNLTPDQQASIPDDVPEEELAVWNDEIQTDEPQILDENWGIQDELDDFEAQKSQYMTIDELMAQVEGEEGISPEDEELKLDVGLSEFPDVIGDIGDIDVDNNSEAAGKLDLAKIYIEMNDDKGAIKLLEEAIVDGSDDIRREAKSLIDSINRRA